ncbi:long-chain-fatty-acid--CoA ligase [Kineococcus radiotolerans]|uniref:AMP-dependent synthetase and ligase n=1 Tax=Kineococcus radiotolerans (strain ATCC BAA-149 / DSM 14245 / SRS30216) TaxID=266940 RepID=A6WDT0_KINRD|nr:long-chain fatty acid--CoA ligase [Kineococcus radiotolerans]ABS04969.1 AMP-dependent synthetase and ligase [Kineococcus radiotolerans SRS30216 = ATCC BAA-149]
MSSPTTFAGAVAEHARTRPDGVAVRLDEHVLTWRELDDATARVAALLRAQGVRPGDRVALVLPNVPQFPVLYHGILRAGAVVVPMNPLLRGREVNHHFADSGAVLALVWHAVADASHAGAVGTGTRVVVVEPGATAALLAGVDPDPAVHVPDPGDTAVILYTSGTTGAPKGAELSHRNLLSNALTSQERLIRLGGDDVILGALPLFHAFGQTCAMNTAVVAGRTLSLLPRFSAAAALAVVERDRVTHFAGVPTMYVALLNEPGAEEFDLSSWRSCVSGGASLPVEVLRGFEARFGVQILEGYGLSETSPVASFNHPDAVRKPGTIGVPVRGCEMDLRGADGTPVTEGVGEIVVRGENVMTGYWRNEAATAAAFTADGWFRTGDLATRDEDGYYAIVDRAKDMIDRGGYNVYPREVEEVLHEHPAVEQVAVVGFPDPLVGEEVGAAVVLKEGACATPEELQQHVKDALAAYKYPRRVWIVSELPKGPTGKILKREIHPPLERTSES